MSFRDKYSSINTFFTQQAESKIKIKPIHLTYCLQPIRFTSLPTITIPRQINNKKQSTSQAKEDIPASTSKTEECLSTENKILIEDQQKAIDKLMKRTITLEGKFYELEERLLIIQTVNRHHLESMIDSQSQYYRRPYLVINGMAEPGNKSDHEKLILSRLKEESGIDEDVIQQNIDKIHPISQPEYGKQRRIVKFTRNGFKERVFMKRKQRKKS